MASLLLLSSAAFSQARPDMPAMSPPLDRILPLEVSLNGEQVGTWPFVERQGMLYASKDALEEWRVQLRPGAEPIKVRGIDYWPLSAVPGYAAKANYSTQSVELNFAAEAFTSTKLTKQITTRQKTSPVLPSAFANYELNYSASRTQAGTRSSSLGAVVEVGGSTELGVLTSAFVGRNLTHSSADPAGWLRLETTFTRHFPDHNYTLRLGDSGTRPGLWGRTVYFGGVQFATNYALTPGFLTQPVPTVAGVSSSPSTVELYVNGVLKQVSQVPTGPFVIDNSAALSGSGEARLVVKDILGREIVITQPFFSSASLLAAGLADFSAEAGTLRRDLGTASGKYGPPFTSATWRYGLNDNVTAEVRGEGTHRTRTGGVGLIATLPFQTLGRLAAARSDDAAAGSGFQWLVGLERQWATTAAYFQMQTASRAFRMLGISGTSLPTRRQTALNITHTTADYGSFGFAAASLQDWDGLPATNTVSLSYSLRLPGNASLNANATRAFGKNASGTSLGLNLSVPLESNRQVTAVVQTRAGQVDAYATASQTAGLDTELGWRVLGGRQSNEHHFEGGLYYQGRHGNLFSDLSTSTQQTSVRAGGSGGLVFTAGQLFATRRIEQAYALVEVKDVEGIGVGLGTNMLTRTDGKGIALVPNLGAYTPNQIRLNAQDLSISTEIDSIEQIVVPAWRSAVKAEFMVRSGRAALLRIQFDDGEPAPAGATIRMAGQKEDFIVARRGEAYVTGLEPGSKLELEWDGQRCGLQVNLPPADKDEVLRIGPVRCAGVKR